MPYFCLPANDLNDVIAPSCYSCFDYPNALADMVVGYMGVPWGGVEMTKHMQYVTVRTPRLPSGVTTPAVLGRRGVCMHSRSARA